MKRLSACYCVLLLFAAMPVPAQTPAPEKETVVVDFFLRDRAVPAPYAETLRAYVLGGFADRGRHNVIDAETVPVLAGSVP